jgi:hypothetical protein
VGDLGSNNCLLGISLDERKITGCSVRTERGQVVNGLYQIGFTLAVLPLKQVYSRLKLDFGGLMVSEVSQR